MDDGQFLDWLRDRLICVYGENENVDFVHRLTAIADRANLASGQTDPVGEFVGYQKIGFQQVPIIRWNRHVPMGTQLYATPPQESADDVLVPKEPTQAMLEAADTDPLASCENGYDEYRAIYKAMLRAALAAERVDKEGGA